MKSISNELEMQIYIDAVKDGYLINDSKTNKITNCNKAFEIMTGYTKDELLGLDIKKLFLEKSINEIQICSKNNKLITCEIQKTNHKNETEEFTICIVKKISNETNLENKFLDTLIETIPAPIFSKDKDFRYNYCNQAFLDFLGKEKKDIIGKNVWELSPKDLADKYHEADLSVIKDKKQSYESKVVYADGTRHKVIFHKSIYYDINENFAGIIGLIVDNTEKIELLEKLKEKTKQLDDFVSASTDFVWEVNENGSYTYASEGIKDFLGYAPEEVVGKTPFDLMLKEESENIGKVFAEILKEKLPIKDLMNWNVHKNGEKILFLTNGIPIYDLDGKFMGYRGTDKDITKEYKRQEEIRKKDLLMQEQSKMAAMGEMIGNIAHQWRQPLNVISTAASGICLKYEMGDLNDKNVKEITDAMITSTQFLSKTIDTFRDFIKGDKKPIISSVQKEIIQTKDIVNAILKNSHIELQEKIDYDIPLDVNIVSGELPQVLINIFQNAKDAFLEHEIKDPKIRLTLIEENDNAVITIEDNAGGIDKKILPKIFEPYITTKHQSQGTGLGLHMSYRLVTESIGGKIYAKNTSNGAKFFIEIPLNKIV